jgi:heparan-alpha-glucosaminide N-acetyltransferase
MSSTTTLPAAASADIAPLILPTPRSSRIMSVDALRGLVMLTMIFVNDIGRVSKRIVPWWLRHFKENGNGMTFVDLVFPAFLFIVGMSIPLALGSRLEKGEPLWKIVLHVIGRTLGLLLLGIMTVHDSPDSDKMGWSDTLWSALMLISAIIAFCSLSPRSSTPEPRPSQIWRAATIVLRCLGFASLIYLAFAFRGEDGERIITLSPFFIDTDWYGILGLIGWAYLVASIVFLIFRTNRTALLGCMVLLFCLYPADRKGAFEDFWLGDFVSIGETLGSQAAIAVAGVLLASILVTSNTSTIGARARFTFLFIAGCSSAALLLHRLYGINKNSATLSWCLWACAITAALWLVFYFLADVLALRFPAKLLAIAGANVLLAYLLADLREPVFELLHLDQWYVHLAQPGLANAIGRSLGCAIFILALSVGLNRIGFRLKL